MIYEITHVTDYYYSSNVSLCHNLAHLTARDCPWQTCLTHELQISSPLAVSINRTDYFGNLVTFFTVQEPHRRLEITAINRVEVHPRASPEPAATPPWEAVAQAVGTGQGAEALDACQFMCDSHYVKRAPALRDYAAPSFSPGRPLLEAVVDLTRRIFTEFRFDSTARNFDTPLTELLEVRSGVCQDFSHFQIGCLRTLGLAARYVSGYLLTTSPGSQSRLLGADMSHAWVAIFCPGVGWIDLDPTNNLLCRDEHITLAWGRDYDDVSPLKGVILGGGRHSIRVGVDVVVSGESNGTAPPEA